MPRPQRATRTTTQTSAGTRSLMLRLFDPIPIGPLVYFRIVFGLILLWHMSGYLAGETDLIAELYVRPQFHFKYYGFGWVEPWPGNGLYVHFGVLWICALCITLGLFYPLAAGLFCLGYTYVFLLDQTYYINHFYLKCLVSGLMTVLPANRHLALDALIWPRIHALVVPAWTLWLLRAQFGIVYFYAGVAKLNADWLSGRVMRIWLDQNLDVPILGPWLAEPGAALLFAYGGLLLDLLAAPLLVWRRTRIYAFAATAAFHLLNAVLFHIATFPWMMLFATVLFFSPERFSRFGGPTDVKRLQDRAIERQAAQPGRRQCLLVALLGMYLAVQVIVPMRHFLYPGDVLWTYEGLRFSWNLMQRSMEPVGNPQFVAQDGKGKYLSPPPNPLTPVQQRQMATHPDMILQCAHYIARKLREQGHADVRVYAGIVVTLNGHPPQRYIDSKVDLAAQPRDLRPAAWIIRRESR